MNIYKSTSKTSSRSQWKTTSPGIDILKLVPGLLSWQHTGGSCLSHTVVKPDSCLAWIFVAKFLCIIKLILIIG